MEVKASDGSIIKTGDMVLVRNNDEHNWIISIFGYIFDNNKFYSCINGNIFRQCIPLIGNEHLCGTDNDFEQLYTPKFGDKVEGITYANEKVCGILVGYSNNEETSYKNFTVLKEVHTNHSFTNKYYDCRSIKLIEE